MSSNQGIRKGVIWNWHTEVQTWMAQGSVLAYFNKSRIADFYKEYGSRIETISNEIIELKKRHVKMDEKGEKFIVEGEKFVFIEGHGEADLNQEYSDLMNQFVSEPLKLLKPVN